MMDYDQIEHESDGRTPSPADVDLMDDDETIPEPLPGRAARTRRRPALTTVIGGALVALLVAALVVCLLGWTASQSRNSSQQALRRSAIQAASSYGGYLSSYDYRNLTGPTAPWTEVDQHSTASFRKDFDSTRSSLKSLVTDYKATATGKVIATGLSSLSPSRAVALLFIDQTVTNTAQKPGTTTQPLRVELVLDRQHGRWLIDKLEVPK